MPIVTNTVTMGRVTLYFCVSLALLLLAQAKSAQRQARQFYGTGSASCPEGWKAADNECLKFFHGIDNNSPGRTAELCASHGATPIIIDSQQKTDLIMEIFPDEEYFCFPGMQKIGGRWVNADGSAVQWTNWRSWPPEPQGDGDCISVLFSTANGEWNDVPCMSHCGNVALCAAPPLPCRDGFTLLNDWGECLQYVHDVPNNSPQVAIDTCNSMGADPVLIDTQAKSDAIGELFPNEEYFCFPDMMKRDGVWMFSFGEELFWTNWRQFPPEPQGDGDCISVLWTYEGQWNDVPCNSDCGNVILCSYYSEFTGTAP